MAAKAFYDAVVVGAGPAGSTLARLLARRDFKTLLVERESPARRRVCGGFLGPETAVLWRRLGLEKEFHDFPKNKIRHVRISGAQSRPLDSSFKRGSGWAVDRGRFDEWLRREAVRSGAELAAETKLLNARSADGLGWHLTLENGGRIREVASRHLIYANGRRQPPSVDPSKTFFACKTVYTGHTMPSDRVALHFIGNGHVGLNPLDPSKATLCLYVEGNHLRSARGDLDEMMRRFLSANASLEEDLGDARRISEWSSCAAEPDGREIFFKEGAFFAGDAVTMVDPIIGGGVPIAVASAMLLAGFLSEAREKKIPDPEVALRYRSAWKRRFGRRLRLAASLGRVERSAWMTRALLSLLNAAPAVFARLVDFSRSSRNEEMIRHETGV